MDSKKNDKAGHIRMYNFLHYTHKQFVPIKSRSTQSDFCLVIFQSDCKNLFCGIWSSQKQTNTNQNKQKK